MPPADNRTDRPFKDDTDHGAQVTALLKGERFQSHALSRRHTDTKVLCPSLGTCNGAQHRRKKATRDRP